MRIDYMRLDSNNFTDHSLDDFVRHQQVTECWRRVDGKWQLLPVPFVEDWSLDQCRSIASDVALHMESDQTAVGAFDGKRLVGFITLSHDIFGTSAKYVEVVCFQVSEEYRGMGIGRELFRRICAEGEKIGAEKLYISGHSSKESQAVYKALGCTHAKEISEKLVNEEPCDVQLEYDLRIKYITLRQYPELKAKAADWFHQKWGVPREAYLECMEDYLSGSSEYGWYLSVDGERIVGGLGVIENDFHNRKDLLPNICAVYTENEYRGRGIAGRLLNMAVEDLRSKGISPVYLLTDHIGFYERYGWEFFCMAQGDGEPNLSRLYIHR